VLSGWEPLPFLQIATASVVSLLVKGTIVATFGSNFSRFPRIMHKIPPNILCVKCIYIFTFLSSETKQKMEQIEFENFKNFGKIIL
jgi:hypothetical protein